MAGVTATARKALSLQRDGVFRLLVVLTALLGWVVALGAAGTVLMHDVYGDWRLERAQTLMVYLLPDSEAAAVRALQVDVARLPGVKTVQVANPADLMDMLEPYVGDGAGLPLPQVLEVSTADGFDRSLFDPVVKARFATAEIDDAQPVVQAVARGVRLVQVGGIALAVMMAVVMVLLVTLTVRAGLRAHKNTLELLQHLGATQGLVTKLVATQVVERALVGWILAALGAAAALGLGMWAWPVLPPYVQPQVWGALVLAPAVLPLVAWLAARRVVKQLVQPVGRG